MPLIANKAINVLVSADRLVVSLAANAGAGGGSALTVEQVMNDLAGMKIVVDKNARPTISAFVGAINNKQNPENIIVAKGTAAQDGKNGRIEKFYAEPAAQTETEATPGSFYDRSKYIVATEGQQLLRVWPPQDGVDGVDVFGKPLPHKKGHQIHVVPGSNVKQAGEYFTAGCSGIVNLVGDKIAIDPKLEIRGNVDFSSGNITFPGEVIIGKNVLDKFKVHGGADVTIGGIAEAADVQAAGNLLVTGGIAGKEKGVFIVGKDLATKYITNAKIRAGGNITSHGEIVNCDLACDGKLIIENGPLVGGQASVLGGAKLCDLGTSVGTRTILEIGIDDKLKQRLPLVAPEVKIRFIKAGKTRQIVEPLLQNQKYLSHEQKEKATELLYQACELEAEAKKLITELKTLYDNSQKNAAREVEVVGTVFSGAVIRFPKIAGFVTAALKGPLKITTKKINGTLQVVAIDSASNTSITLETSADADGFWEELESLFNLLK